MAARKQAGPRTLRVGIMAFRGTYSTEWGLIFASVTISALPVIGAYLLLSRQFIAGLTAGSVDAITRAGRGRESAPPADRARHAPA